MFEEWNRRFAECKENIRNKEKWEQQLAAVEKRCRDLERQTVLWREMVAREEEDVERLLSMNIANLWYTLTGQKDEKLGQEEKEVLEARLKFDQAAALLEAARLEREQLRERLLAYGPAEEALEELLREKEQLIHRFKPELAEELVRLSEETSEAGIRLKELNEAIVAGRNALGALEIADSNLNSAENWSTFDILGGGFIATHMKHSRLQAAQTYAKEAGKKLLRLRDELNDVKMQLSAFDTDISDTLRLGDYFMDGWITDFLVQERIEQADVKLHSYIRQVTAIVQALEQQASETEVHWRRLKARSEALVENA